MLSLWLQHVVMKRFSGEVWMISFLYSHNAPPVNVSGHEVLSGQHTAGR